MHRCDLPPRNDREISASVVPGAVRTRAAGLAPYFVRGISSSPALLTPAFLSPPWFPAFLSPVTWATILVVAVFLLASPPTARVGLCLAADSPTSGLDEAAIKRLVGMLGDDQFQVREQATRELLKAGSGALPQLEEGSRNIDREVRYRCQRILTLVRELELENRLERFMNGTDAGEPPLPGWESLRKQLGDATAIKSLFREMYRVESEFLSTAAKGGRPASEALQTRVSDVQNMLQMHSTEPPIGSILAILFVAVETATDNNNQATAQNIFNLCYQQSFRAAITGGPYRDSVRKLLGAWIRRGEDFQAYQGIMLAMQYEMKDALPPAERLLKNANIQGHMKQYALVAIAKFGDESHIPLLEGALADEKPIGTWQVNNVNINTQLRDVALASLVHVTKQDFKAYGFDRIQMTQPYLFNPITAGFADNNQRVKALDKWKTYRAQNKNKDAEQNAGVKPAP
jgi:hypothetical protein